MAQVDAPHVYITYHRDPQSEDFATRLAADLTGLGAVTALIDDSPSAPAATRAMLTDPSENRWLLVLVSPPAVTSPWVLSAVNSAQEAVMARRMRGVLAVVVAPTPEQNIPVVWRPFPRFDASQNTYDAARDALFGAMFPFGPANDARARRAADLAHQGEVAEQHRRMEEAESFYQQSLAIVREIGDREGEGVVLSLLGQFAIARGRWDEAESYLMRSMGISRDVGDWRGVGTDLAKLGVVAQRRGRLEEAESYYRQGLDVVRRFGYMQDEEALLSSLGQLSRLRESRDKTGGAPASSAEPSDNTNAGRDWNANDGAQEAEALGRRGDEDPGHLGHLPVPPPALGGLADTTGASAPPPPLYPGAPRFAGEAEDESPDPNLPFEPPPGYPDFKGYGPPPPIPGQPPAPQGAPPAPPAPAPYGPPSAVYPSQAPALPSPAPSQIGGARPAPPAPIALEQVAFAAYYPKEAQPAKSLPLLVYLALDEAPVMARVAALAAERLAGRLDQFRSSVAGDRMTLRRGTKLRLVPVIPGFHVNPQWMDVTWDEDAQQHEFSVRADSAQEGRAADGAVRVYQGLNLRAQIPVSIFVNAGAGGAPTPADFASAYARAYRHVFASYSHSDTPVVESCEAAARAFGDRFLRDIITLQSGQVWNPQLMKMIAEADVFQLFWSRSAAASPYVRQEWEYALTLQTNRPGFIHPVYWSRTVYKTPPELGALHFAPLDLSALGWSPVRRFLYSLQTG